MSVSGFVERQFFYPDAVQYAAPGQFGLRSEDVWLHAPDGSKLHGWFLPAQGAAKGTVLHLHGNAANISNHLPLVAWLPGEGYNVLLVDYRGFGRSQGQPSLDGVVDDAAAALAYLRTRSDVDAGRLIVLGQSLGGATALRLLARDAAGVRLAIIDSAFASYRQIAREAMMGSVVLVPAIPLVLPALPGDDKDPIVALKSVGVPLVFVHGTRDAVIGHDHSVQLHAAARAPKELWTVEGADHMMVFGVSGPWRQRLVQAMDAAVR
ncbi:MAG TPA: alpha/beta hydrolase [Burkholderiaceae bacterium]|nr:alpha/beta hydrolase [Burkholderiaceae bacterium]HQR72304.1 alpha/beta hydrolase [Burkholderiaceae bacterium]